MPTFTPQDFVSKWKRVTSREKQTYREHFIDLFEQRDRWLNAEGLSEAEKKKRTLTNLYNARPTWLDLAHKRLDEAVFAAYGWKSGVSDEQTVEKMLSFKSERSQSR